jgi:hypothetical protein
MKCITMMTNHASKLLILLGLLSSSFTADSARVKRVKAGKVYKEHDPVHIVVNKVG